jgi:hypothetical protein
MIVLKRIAKQSPCSLPPSISGSPMDGSERDDATNLHPHFQGPTKETFIEA